MRQVVAAVFIHHHVDRRIDDLGVLYVKSSMQKLPRPQIEMYAIGLENRWKIGSLTRPDGDVPQGGR